MALNDPLANVLSHIYNAEKKGKKNCDVRPTSRMIKEVLRVMKENKYLGDVQEVTTEKGGALHIDLLGAINNCGVVKPRFSITKGAYEKYERRYLPAKAFGILVITTSKGIMTHNEALEKGVGGRLIAYCY